MKYLYILFNHINLEYMKTSLNSLEKQNYMIEVFSKFNISLQIAPLRHISNIYGVWGRETVNIFF